MLYVLVRVHERERMARFGLKGFQQIDNLLLVVNHKRSPDNSAVSAARLRLKEAICKDAALRVRTECDAAPPSSVAIRDQSGSRRGLFEA
jgi:hypothetical protein